jgi:hypothetical protein
MSKMRAFIVTETALEVTGLVFAESAGKARMIAVRSAWECGFQAKISTTKVRRNPALDGRMPVDYRRQFYSLDHIKYLPIPNAQAIDGVAP